MLLKAFRLFVSSTFGDFVQERERLQSKVFPALDAYCAAKGYQFRVVDLRWGVNEEAQLDQRTAEICLGEVEAAKRYPPPNLLIMVGNRYGWVPLPFAIAWDEFEAATAWLAERGRVGDVRDLCKVYWLDRNHLVPPGLTAAADSEERIGAYTLRPREDELLKFAPPKAWEKLEKQLRGAMQKAADHLAREGRISEMTRAKYFLSLTEQEIVEGLKNKAQPSSGQADRGGPQSIAWIREHAGAGDHRVETLNAGIRRALPGDCVLSGHAIRNWRGRLKAAYLEDFAARIERRLREAIDEHIAERSEVPELAHERVQHEAFAVERCSVFFGRDSNRSVIASYLTGDSPHPFVLFGHSGLGKSALMARAVADAEEAGRGVRVIYRFVGASAASADVRSLLVSIVEDLAAHGIAAKPKQWEDDANKFDEQIRTLLLSIDRPVTIFIDALDQLRKPSQTTGLHRLGWLPDQLPPQLKIVVSALNDKNYKEDSGVYRALQQRLPSQAFLEIEPLTQTQGRDILMALEGSAQRRLRPGQRDYVVGQFEKAGASPLYLRMAFEIARGWRSWDEAGQGRCVLAGDTAALIGQLIAELSSVHHHEPALVSRTLGYLAAAKDGLSAKEVTEVLSGDIGVMKAISAEKHGVRTPSFERHGERKPKLPDSVWVRLNRQLAPLLVEKRVDEQPLLQFFHRQMADIARDRHYAPAKAALHGALADYFDAGAGTAGKDAAALGRTTFARRSLSELPYQLLHAGRRARLDAILMAPDWMQQKLAAAGVRMLIDDYQYAHTKAQRLTGQTLELAAGVLARDQRQLAPQLLGRLRADLGDEPAEAGAIDGLLRDGRARLTPPVLLPRWASLTVPGGPELRRFEGNASGVNAVAFSSDGRHIVSGSDDGIVRLWEVASGASRALEGHGLQVNAVAFSPDGRYVVSGSGGGTLRLWEVESGASRALGGHGDWVYAVAFSPDGRRVVSGSSNGTLRLWEVASGTSRVLEGHRDRVRAVAFSPDGRCVVSGSEDRTLRLWEVESAAVRALEGHRGPVNAVAFSPDGCHVVSGSADSTLRLWEVESGASLALEGHSGWVHAVAFSPDGRYVVSGSNDRTLRLWEVSSGTSRMLEGHGGRVTAVAFSPDGRRLVSGSEDRTLRLWEVASGAARELERHGGRVNAVAFSPDGRHVVSGSDDRTLRLWEVASGTSLALECHSGRVNTVLFSPDGRHVVSGSADCTLHLWEVASGAWRALVGHRGDVRALAFSPDGRHVVSGSNDRTLRLWEVSSAAARALEGHGGRVNVVAFSPDGRHVVSGSEDRTLRLWEVASGASCTLGCHLKSVDAVAFSPDGRHVVSGLYDGTLHLWEVANGAARALEGHGGGLRAVAFSPDGRHVVSGSGYGPLRLWEVASGASRVLEGHGLAVWPVAFSPDGRHVVSGSWDHTLRLWEVSSEHQLARLDGDFAFLALAVAPDGTSIAAGDEDGRVHLIDIILDEADKAAWLARWGG